MGMKTSPNGVLWSDHNGGDMIMSFSEPQNGVSYCWPLGVSYSQDGGYTGYLGGQPEGMTNQSTCQTYAFTGTNIDDPASFVYSSDTAMRAGPEAYDLGGHASIAVVQYDENTWYMFYIGFESWNYYSQFQSSHGHSLNLATSTDGVTWTKSPNNPLPINRISPGVVSDVAAQKVGSRVLVWVTDQYDEIAQNAVGLYLFEPDVEVHSARETTAR
jgi:hypothetical protein